MTSSLDELFGQLRANGLLINLFQLSDNSWQSNIHKPKSNSYTVTLGVTAQEAVAEGVKRRLGSDALPVFRPRSKGLFD